MTMVFRCGHTAEIDPDKVTSPVCLVCGERRVARVRHVEPPRITGHARGPHVTPKHLEPVAVQIATKPLPLKEPTDAD